jgi:hypothetical protein
VEHPNPPCRFFTIFHDAEMEVRAARLGDLNVGISLLSLNAVVMSFNDRPVYRAASDRVYHPGSIDVSFILGLNAAAAISARVCNPFPTG